ncbi:hypothetical protein CEXT_430231 [Caerostris extrusa]|uniref:Secreted protein n=1 Tax=Caerostris extrusa TaxID=172846 RepID=A0AAV4XYN5_CAEEX|nr:hypothetical protein CEXT_430231 [Caerostris extrusa]
MLVLMLFYTAFIQHILYRCKNQCFKGRFALTAIKQPRPSPLVPYSNPTEFGNIWSHFTSNGTPPVRDGGKRRRAARHRLSPALKQTCPTTENNAPYKHLRGVGVS